MKKKHFDKILLINPPIEDFYQTKIRQEPLGLNYIWAVLRSKNESVILLDALNAKFRQTIPYPAEFQYLKNFYPPNDLSPFRLFNHFYHFGMSFQTIEQQIQIIKPDIIGISANFSPYLGSALKIARLAKRAIPDVIIVLGGHHVSAVPEDLIRMPDIDFIVIGEGESTFPNLIDCLSANDFDQLKTLKGIALHENGQVRINLPTERIQKLNQLPYPILNIPAKEKMLLTSRGCPMNCHFCSVQNVMGRKIRLREISSVISEINHWVNRGITHFDFEDDNLVFHPNRAKQLFEAILQTFNPETLSFSAMNGLSAEFLDEELLQLMKQLHFTWLNLPLVSGQPEIQSQINRHQSKEKFLEIVAMANRVGLKVVAYLIIGLPNDSVESMLSDILLLAGQQVLIGPSIFYPPPGSAIYKECLKRGYIKPHQYSALRSSAIPVETDYFDRRDIATLFRIIRAINFTKQLLDESNAVKLNAYHYFAPWNRTEKIFSEHKLTSKTIGKILLSELFINKRLRGMKLPGKKVAEIKYKMFDYNISQDIVDEFLGKLCREEICGVTSNTTLYF